MLINAKKVTQLLGCKESTAYAIIKRLNTELEKKGYLTLRGKVDQRYLLDRFNLQSQGEVS